MNLLDSKTINVSLYIITVLATVYSAYQLEKISMIASMIPAAVVLGIGGYYVLKKREKSSFIYVKDVYAFMWAALYLILPINQKPVMENIKQTFTNLGHSISSGNSLVLYYAGTLILFIILQKWKQTIAYRAGLYVIVSLLAAQLFQITVLVDMGLLIYYTAAFSFLCERISKDRTGYRPLFKCYLLLLTGLYILLILYPYDSLLLERIGNLFYLKSVWPHVTAIILISGIICIVENLKNLEAVAEGELPESIIIGGALISMAIYIAAGKIWPQFFNCLIVYLAAPTIILIMQYVDKKITSANIKFSVSRAMLLCLPAAGRTLNERRWYYCVVYALFVVYYILMKMKWSDDKEKIIMQDFWGIAAIILLFSSRYKIIDINILRTLVYSLIMLVGSCVLWVMLTHRTYAFDKQLREGRYSKNDYAMLPLLQKISIGLILVITLIILMFL